MLTGWRVAAGVFFKLEIFKIVIMSGYFWKVTFALMAFTGAMCSCESEEIDKTPTPESGTLVGTGSQAIETENPSFGFDMSGLSDSTKQTVDSIFGELSQYLKENARGESDELVGEEPENGKDALINLWGNRGVRQKVINYTSVDGNGNPIEISAVLYWPYSKKPGTPNIRPNDIVIYCHETMFSASEAPSAQKSNNFGNLAIDGNLVVIPDYIGFGETSDLNQTYLCQNLIARNCMDAILAAISAAGNADMEVPALNNGYGTYILGYSQGGGNAFALTRYIETKATDDQRQKINLKRSFVGSGPYNPALTFECWLRDGKMTMPTLLAMVLQGFQAGYKKQLAGYDLKTYFSDAFLETGILDALANKTMSTMEVAGALASVFPDSVIESSDKTFMSYYKLSAIMSDKAKDAASDCRQRLQACLEEENQLADGWTPQHHISFFYTSGDDMVPCENTLTACEKYESSGMVSKHDCKINQHILAQIAYMVYAVGLDGYKSDDGLKNIPAQVTNLINSLIGSLNLM